MKATNIIAAFLGGAIVGAGAALLFAPEKGEDLRAQIKSLLKKYGVCKCSRTEELEELVDEIAAEIQEAKK
ncbi:MAG: YtxH domain-containing protein [Muribaculaceae bacterium]|nr:YtxH domain-containing protein [Muribaculaceae bacterium]